MIRLAGTGHRVCTVHKVYKWLEAYMELHERNETHFITGGACGFDNALARACAELDVPFEIVLPFPYDIHTSRWGNKDKFELKSLMSLAKSVTVLSDVYSTSVYLERNRKMVDMCDEVVAYWNGVQKGGTFYTVEYAKKKHKVIHYV